MLPQLASSHRAAPAAPIAANGLQHTSAQATPVSSSIADAVLQAIVEAGGNIRLAGDRLQEAYPSQFPERPTPAILASYLEGRQSELKERMELVQLLNMLSLMPQLQKTLTENLTSLEGADAVRAYTEIQNLIQRSVKKDELTINLNDMRWKLLPRNIAQLFADLEASGQLEQAVQIIDHDPAA